jgi:hypothetical protein
MRTTIRRIATGLSVLMLGGSVASAATAPAEKCEASKNKAAGDYYSCLAKAEATAITKAIAPDYSKCTAKFDDKWEDAETKGDGTCPDTVLTAAMNAFLAGQAADAASVIAGGDLPSVCGDGAVGADEDCDVGNLNGATCATQPGFLGGTLACSFCTFDTSDCYATRFDASGDTILDHETGLEWEKKDGADGAVSLCPGGATCDNPHDVDNRYQWSSTNTDPDGGAFIEFLAELNAPDGPGASDETGPTETGCYAGHCDWRLPTVEELHVIPRPPVAEFLPDASSDYIQSNYWCSSTAETWPPNAWYVSSRNSDTDTNPKTAHYFVRAVRSGP